MTVRAAFSPRATNAVTVNFTIAIPTHNRAALVRDTLASVASLAIPAGVEADCVVMDEWID